MATFLPLPTKNNTSILSDWYTRATNFTNSLLGIAGEDYPKGIHMNTGSWTIQAIDLVYDDILRFNKGGVMNTTTFNHSRFASNMLWWIDNLSGMESEWTQDALNTDKEGNTAYGYTQITEDSLPTALNRYTNHIDRYNERHEDISYPEWVVNSKKYLDEGLTHIEIIDMLSYDQVCALTIVHAHSKNTDDHNWVKIQDADAVAAKSVYSKGHHTKPDAATLKRMENFWVVRKETAHTLLSAIGGERIIKTCPFAQTKTISDVMTKLTEKCIFHNGEELYNSYVSIYPSDKILDTTGLFKTDYKKYVSGLTNKTLLSGGAYKGFRHTINSNLMDYYFYRSGDVKSEALTMLKSELSGTTTSISYNYDEVYDSIDSWPNAVHIYVMDWFKVNSTDHTYLIPSTTPDTGWTAGFFIPDSLLHPNGHVVMGLSTGSARDQLSTLFHEVGGHGMHRPGNNWGGDFSSTSGDSSILSNVQTSNLRDSFKNYDSDRIVDVNKIANQMTPVIASYQNNRQAWLNSINVNGITHAITKGLAAQKAKDFAEYERLRILHGSLKHKYFDELPLTNLRNLESYQSDNIEEEFLSRIYSIMATNKCVTFVDDIWPVMTQSIPTLNIDLKTAKQIDIIMRDEMMLNQRTYNI